MVRVGAFCLTFASGRPPILRILRRHKVIPNFLGAFRLSFRLCFHKISWGLEFQPWRHGVRLFGCSRQLLFVDRRPFGWSRFPLHRLPNVDVFQALDLHSSDLVQRFRLWACLFLWGWPCPFRMLERRECSLLGVRASFGKPTGHRAVPTPTSPWLFLAFSSVWLVEFCLLPSLAHCFKRSTVWSIDS